MTQEKKESVSPVTELAPLPVAQPSPASSQSPSLPSPQQPDAAAPAFKATGASSQVLVGNKPAISAPQLARIRVRVVVSGQSRVAQVAVKPKTTVGPLLAAMGISLGALDRVMPDASAIAKDGMTVRVTRVQSQLKTRRIPIQAQTLYRPSTAIAAGRKQVTQTRRDGYFVVTERVWLRDGQVSKREFVIQKVGLAPRDQIVSLGTKSHIMPNAIRPHRRYANAQRLTRLASRGGSPLDRALYAQLPAQPGAFRIVKTISGVTSTGYSAGPAGGAVGNWTATGVRCTYGAVAVDPRVIPLGSKLYIEGYGYGFACDTGGAIKGKHIDLAFNSPRAAFSHGRRRVTVHILAP